MNFLAGLAVGGFLGAFIGVLTMALARISADSDRRAEEMFEQRQNGTCAEGTELQEEIREKVVEEILETLLSQPNPVDVEMLVEMGKRAYYAGRELHRK